MFVPDQYVKRRQTDITQKIIHQRHGISLKCYRYYHPEPKTVTYRNWVSYSTREERRAGVWQCRCTTHIPLRTINLPRQARRQLLGSPDAAIGCDDGYVWVWSASFLCPWQRRIRGRQPVTTWRRWTPHTGSIHHVWGESSNYQETVGCIWCLCLSSMSPGTLSLSISICQTCRPHAMW